MPTFHKQPMIPLHVQPVLPVHEQLALPVKVQPFEATHRQQPTQLLCSAGANHSLQTEINTRFQVKLKLWEAQQKSISHMQLLLTLVEHVCMLLATHLFKRYQQKVLRSHLNFAHIALGEVLSQISLKQVRGITLSQSGMIYVTSYHSIKTISPTGNNH